MILPSSLRAAKCYLSFKCDVHCVVALGTRCCGTEIDRASGQDICQKKIILGRLSLAALGFWRSAQVLQGVSCTDFGNGRWIPRPLFLLGESGGGVDKKKLVEAKTFHQEKLDVWSSLSVSTHAWISRSCTYTHTHTHTYICIHVYVYIHIYIYNIQFQSLYQHSQMLYWFVILRVLINVCHMFRMDASDSASRACKKLT